MVSSSPPPAATVTDEELGFLGPAFMSGSFSADGVSDNVLASLGEEGVCRLVRAYVLVVVFLFPEAEGVPQSSSGSSHTPRTDLQSRKSVSAEEGVAFETPGVVVVEL